MNADKMEEKMDMTEALEAWKVRREPNYRGT